MSEENNYLKRLGFDDDEIEDIMMNVQEQIDVKSLHEKIKFLISLGLDARQIRIIIEENFLFVTEELNNIIKNAEILLKYLNKEELPSSLEIEPDLITTDKSFLEENIKLIKKYVNEKDLKILLLDRGEIFTYIPKYLKEKIEFLIENNLEASIFSVIINYIEFFELENDEIDIDELKKVIKGW